MKKWNTWFVSTTLLVAVAIAEITWRYFYGIDLIPGDHETGTVKELFLKQRPTWQYEFHHPQK